jgi:hypothetical protein
LFPGEDGTNHHGTIENAFFEIRAPHVRAA